MAGFGCACRGNGLLVALIALLLGRCARAPSSTSSPKATASVPAVAWPVLANTAALVLRLHDRMLISGKTLPISYAPAPNEPSPLAIAVRLRLSSCRSMRQLRPFRGPRRGIIASMFSVSISAVRLCEVLRGSFEWACCRRPSHLNVLAAAFAVDPRRRDSGQSPASAAKQRPAQTNQQVLPAASSLAAASARCSSAVECPSSRDQGSVLETPLFRCH